VNVINLTIVTTTKVPSCHWSEMSKTRKWPFKPEHCAAIVGQTAS